MSADLVLLMYHELERPGRPLCETDPGYTRYVVKEADFQAHLNHLRDTNQRGLNLSQAMAGEKGVVLTFDDGPESDLVVAAPLLREMGFGATFYIVAGWVGTRPGFLKPEQIRQLADAGMEIGSHGMSHAFMSDLKVAELRRELAESKAKLEEISGKPVLHFSCPGGRWSETVGSIAAEVGYETVSTSRIGIGNAQTERFCLPRMAVTCNTSLADFTRLCRGELSGKEKMRHQALTVAKSLLGNGVYQKARGAMLGGKNGGNA